MPCFFAMMCSLMIMRKESADLFHSVRQHVRLRQQNQAEVILLLTIKAGAGHDQNVRLMQKIHGETVIVGDVQRWVDTREHIESALVFHK